MFSAFSLPHVLCASAACTFSTSQLPKVLRSWHSLNTFHFHRCFAPQRRALFRISISKSGPELRCFHAFHPKVCFAPQRRALFRHLNVQKCSENGVSCTCRPPNVVCATTACNLSSLIWPAGSAPAALASYFLTLRSHKSRAKHRVPPLSYLSRFLIFYISYLLPSDFLHAWASSWLCFAICPYCRKFSSQASFE